MSNYKSKYLEYDHEKSYLPADCKVNISPSSFANFVSQKHNWYKQQVLKEDRFMGSTSSVLGTVVHSLAACIAKGEDVDKEAIYEYIEDNKKLEDYCSITVEDNFEQMATELINNYVLPNMDNYHSVEETYMASLGNGVYVSGSIDFTEGEKDDICIGDYKTYNSKSKPKSIPMNYKYQLLVYAWLLKQNGYNPTRIKLVYVNRSIDGEISEKTGKRLKSYPTEVTVLVESIDEESLEFIGSLLQLCKETLLATKKHPELTHVLWSDMRLKQT
jgi:ATP-dependent helicase/DNAse subunit B